MNDVLLAECMDDSSITLLAGSLQCDSFSNLKSSKLKEANRANGTPGDAELFYPLLKLIERTSPAVVFIENVPAFLNSEIGGAFKAILNRTGYYVSQAVLNGADFGTRCSRPRGFLVASVWPGFVFPEATGRADGTLFDFLGEAIMQDCRDITDSGIVRRAIAKKRMRVVDETKATAPVFPKSQARVDDRVLFSRGGRIFDPSISAMRKVHGLPASFKLDHLPKDLQVEQIGQGVDYYLLSLLANAIGRHVNGSLQMLI